MKKHIKKIFAAVSSCIVGFMLPYEAIADTFVDTTQQIQVRYDVTPAMIATPQPVIATPFIVTPQPVIRPIIQTGDNSNVKLLALIAAISLLVAIAVYIYIRKSGGIRKHEK